jgi:hypothetical protein
MDYYISSPSSFAHSFAVGYERGAIKQQLIEITIEICVWVE